MTKAELESELERIHNMQLECSMCANSFMSEDVRARAKAARDELNKRENAIESQLRVIAVNWRIEQLGRIEKELGIA